MLDSMKSRCPYFTQNGECDYNQKLMHQCAFSEEKEEQQFHYLPGYDELEFYGCDVEVYAKYRRILEWYRRAIHDKNAPFNLFKIDFLKGIVISTLDNEINVWREEERRKNGSK